jgi:hypothetical protein
VGRLRISGNVGEGIEEVQKNKQGAVFLSAPLEEREIYGRY